MSPVDAELEVLIDRCDGEWRTDAEILKEELGAIHGSFFQLEFDRVNEKLVFFNLFHAMIQTKYANLRKRQTKGADGPAPRVLGCRTRLLLRHRRLHRH